MKFLQSDQYSSPGFDQNVDLKDLNSIENPVCQNDSPNSGKASPCKGQDDNGEEPKKKVDHPEGDNQGGNEQNHPPPAFQGKNWM